MLDTELREQLLEGYYTRRKSDERLPNDLEEKYPDEELIRITKQLDEKRLVDLDLHTSENGTVVLWEAQITARGIEYIESDADGGDPEINVQTSDSQNIQVGNRNVQIVQSALNEVVRRINDENASEKEKRKAKSKLAQFLSHPLVVSILGDLTTQIPELKQYLPE
jgi:hypothetical protein